MFHRLISASFHSSVLILSSCRSRAFRSAMLLAVHAIAFAALAIIVAAAPPPAPIPLTEAEVAACRDADEVFVSFIMRGIMRPDHDAAVQMSTLCPSSAPHAMRAADSFLQTKHDPLSALEYYERAISANATVAAASKVAEKLKAARRAIVENSAAAATSGGGGGGVWHELPPAEPLTATAQRLWRTPFWLDRMQTTAGLLRRIGWDDPHPCSCADTIRRVDDTAVCDVPPAAAAAVGCGEPLPDPAPLRACQTQEQRAAGADGCSDLRVNAFVKRFKHAIECRFLSGTDRTAISYARVWSERVQPRTGSGDVANELPLRSSAPFRSGLNSTFTALFVDSDEPIAECNAASASAGGAYRVSEWPVLSIADPRPQAAPLNLMNWYEYNVPLRVPLVPGTLLMFPSHLRVTIVPPPQPPQRATAIPTLFWAQLTIERIPTEAASPHREPTLPRCSLLASNYSGTPNLHMFQTDRASASAPALHFERWATPVLSFALPPAEVDASALNKQLIALIHRLKAADGAGVQKSNRGGWQSTAALYESHGTSEPALAQLRRWIDRAVREYVQELATPEPSGQTHPPVGDIQFHITQLWAGVNRAADHNMPHTHPDSTLSGVYYVSSGAGYTPLRLIDPTLNTDTGVYDHSGGGACESAVNNTAGTIVVFPAWLEHWVAPHQPDTATAAAPKPPCDSAASAVAPCDGAGSGDDPTERIMISFNVRVVFSDRARSHNEPRLKFFTR